MKRFLLLILILLMLLSGFFMGCNSGLQTFSKYGLSFKVSKELKLEEYTVNFDNQTFRIGTASYKQGAVLSSEKNFMLLWCTPIPKFTQEEIRSSILTTPDTFNSPLAKIVGNLVTEDIAGFEVTFAEMQFTKPGWEAPGITAVWYCPISQRIVQIILIHKQPEEEMNRFINSFFDGPHD